MAIVDYISDDNPAAAQVLKDDIETKVSRLRQNPRLYRKGRVEGTREMVVRSNYLVVYTEDAETVTILLILREQHPGGGLRQFQPEPDLRDSGTDRGWRQPGPLTGVGLPTAAPDRRQPHH